MAPEQTNAAQYTVVIQKFEGLADARPLHDRANIKEHCDVGPFCVTYFVMERCESAKNTMR
jgi:hypothetical protein